MLTDTPPCPHPPLVIQEPPVPYMQAVLEEMAKAMAMKRKHCER